MNITFDTLDATKRLREAGFDEKQAETVVRVLSDAQSNLVTREHFDAKFSKCQRKRSGYIGQSPGFRKRRGFARAE